MQIKNECTVWKCPRNGARSNAPLQPTLYQIISPRVEAYEEDPAIHVEPRGLFLFRIFFRDSPSYISAEFPCVIQFGSFGDFSFFVKPGGSDRSGIIPSVSVA